MPAIVFIAVVVGFIFEYSGLSRLYDHYALDIQSIALQNKVASDIVVVEIDSRSINELSVWPWPRKHHADLIDILLDADPERIFLDIDFSNASTDIDDLALQASINSSSKGKIVLPVFWQAASENTFNLEYFTKPLNIFSENTTLTNINVLADENGDIRTLKKQHGLYPSAAFELYNGSNNLSSSIDEVYLDYRIDPESFKSVSFIDVINGNVNPVIFNDKMVFVGSTAVELRDFVNTPIHNAIPGVIFHAIAYESLNHSKLTTLPNYYVVMFTVLIGGLLTLWLAGITSNFKRTAIFTGVVLSLHLGSFLAYAYLDVIVNNFFMVSALATIFVLSAFQKIDFQSKEIGETRQELDHYHAVFNNIFENTDEGIVLISKKGDITASNESASTIFNVPHESILKTNLVNLLPGFKTILKALESRKISEDDLKNHQLVLKGNQGEDKIIELSVANHKIAETDSTYTVVVRDITVQKQNADKLQYMATHDFLTGLPNRRAFIDELMNLCSTNNDGNKKISMLLVDLVGFKEINDTLGHGEGDQVLLEVGNRLTAVATNTNNCFVGRLGGDEFGVILTDFKDQEEIVGFCKKLLDRFKKGFKVSEITVEVRMNIGISLFDDTIDNHIDLMVHADTAMYYAKSHKLNYSFYNAENDTSSIRQLTIKSAARNALQNEEFEVYYQPIINLSTWEMEKVEALLRWKHPQLGYISPDEFIPIIENMQLIRPLTMWVLKTALRDMQLWKDTHLDIAIAINISPVNFMDQEFSTALISWVEAFNYDPSTIELEITEGIAYVQEESGSNTLQNLKDFGFRISIDDYGTGYSSLSYLEKMPVTTLKIDKYFIHKLANSERDEMIVQSTIALAEGLGFDIIAEGVETEQQLIKLMDMGCDYCQGYYFSEAIPAEELEQWAKKWNSEQGSALARMKSWMN
tara:strand:- start:1740 stop:4511 length:2772 start_codon:yes stop_codon:yes gene_type:complete